MMEATEDVEAEIVVIGCVIASPQGAAAAHSALTADMFTRPYLRDLFTVALDLPTRPSTGGLDEPSLCDQRIVEASNRTGIDIGDIARVVYQRPVLIDIAGGYAARVHAAWFRRQTIINLEHAIADIAAGANIDEVLS